MTWTDAQRETAEGLSTGLHLNSGEPCGCGASHYTTTSDVGYSDFAVYTHRCGRCGNVFETYTEG